jgi:hypothetical protein
MTSAHFLALAAAIVAGVAFSITAKTTDDVVPEVVALAEPHSHTGETQVPHGTHVGQAGLA